MKNITFSADERLIEAAREQAAADNTTLNEQFRQWLMQLTRKFKPAMSREDAQAVLDDVLVSRRPAMDRRRRRQPFLPANRSAAATSSSCMT